MNPINHICIKLLRPKSLLTSLLLCTQLIAGEPPSESDEAFNDRTKWFTDAKFGLFIHLGLYSQLAGEWKGETVEWFAEWIQKSAKITPEEYIPLAKTFNPHALNAEDYVLRAKEAGMKYLVVTTKHHEGFCLWDSPNTEFDTGEGTTFDRDILAELSAACKKHGLKFGTYYSIIDWYHLSQRVPQAGHRTPMRDKDGYVTYMKEHLKELIDQYDPDIMWFDGDWTPWWTIEDGADLYSYLRELSPRMLINNRVSKRHEFKKDYGTPENFTPGEALDYLWEACWTVNESWGYKKNDKDWKTTSQLIQKLIDINTKGGNLLLNVGPKGDGSWPAESIQQFKEIGQWTKLHHEAFRHSEYAKLPTQHWGCLNQRTGSSPSNGTVYAYVFNWPKDNQLTVEGILFDQLEVTCHLSQQPIPFSYKGKNTVLDLSEVQATPHASVIELKYSTPPKLHFTVAGLEITGDEIELKGQDATINKGLIHNHHSPEEISKWHTPQAVATWSFSNPAPQKYAVKLYYSAHPDNIGADVKVTIGSQSITAPVLPTGKSSKSFKILHVGEVSLDNVGATKVEIGFGTNTSKELMILKKVYLVPIKD